MDEATVRAHPEPWNKGKLVGQKAPFKLKEIWAIRVRLQLFRRVRELALFDLGIDSKLRACDLVRLKVRDICHGDRVAARAIVMQQKTSRPVQFEITGSTREAVAAWITETPRGEALAQLSRRFSESLFFAPPREEKIRKVLPEGTSAADAVLGELRRRRDDEFYLMLAESCPRVEKHLS
jgi:hypothetical protein